MLFRVESNSIGDGSIPNGTLEWEEVTGKCDNCGCDIDSGESVYKYDGQHVCADCVLDMSYAGTVENLYAEECVLAEFSYWDRKCDEMRDERGNT